MIFQGYYTNILHISTDLGIFHANFMFKVQNLFTFVKAHEPIKYIGAIFFGFSTTILIVLHHNAKLIFFTFS